MTDMFVTISLFSVCIVSYSAVSPFNSTFRQDIFALADILHDQGHFLTQGYKLLLICDEQSGSFVDLIHRLLCLMEPGQKLR